ncbi:hypothetical protein GCM10010420_04320 [Streptomyces glaucosporus]|uniref:DUF4190 domain-containing protein n=1 Tax=Streptomyces glaucosporus TaxID=284044 RepID=A0ABP5UT97_9ACTN
MPSYSYPPPQDWGPYSQDWGHQEPEPPPPGPPPAPAGPPRDGMGIAAFVLGLIALVMFWTVLLGVVPGVLALVFGVVGHRRGRRGEATNGWMALTGAITGFAGLVLSAALVSAALAFLGSDAFGDFRDCVRDAGTPVEQERCVTDLRERFR